MASPNHHKSPPSPHQSFNRFSKMKIVLMQFDLANGTALHRSSQVAYFDEQMGPTPIKRRTELFGVNLHLKHFRVDTLECQLTPRDIVASNYNFRIYERTNVKLNRAIFLASSNHPFKSDALQPVDAFLRESTRLALHAQFVFLALHRHPRPKARVHEMNQSECVNE